MFSYILISLWSKYFAIILSMEIYATCKNNDTAFPSMTNYNAKFKFWSCNLFAFVILRFWEKLQMSVIRNFLYESKLISRKLS